MAKRTRVKAEAHGEKIKKKNLMLTPIAEKQLDQRAAALGISISEYVDLVEQKRNAMYECYECIDCIDIKKGSSFPTH